MFKKHKLFFIINPILIILGSLCLIAGMTVKNAVITVTGTTKIG